MTKDDKVNKPTGRQASCSLRNCSFIKGLNLPFCPGFSWNCEWLDYSSWVLDEKYSVQFRSSQLLSCVRLFATPWIAARQASLFITNSRSSLRLTSIERVMPSSHLILCHPFLLLPPIPPSIRVFSNESTLCMRWPKYWSFSFSIIPFKDHLGLISFRRLVGSPCSPWDSQESSPAPQFKSTNSSALSFLLSPILIIGVGLFQT